MSIKVDTQKGEGGKFASLVQTLPPTNSDEFLQIHFENTHIKSIKVDTQKGESGKFASLIQTVPPTNPEKLLQIHFEKSIKVDT